MQGTANTNFDVADNLVDNSSENLQKKKYYCPPSINHILDRSKYDSPNFLDDLIAAANAQAKGQWRNGKKQYIESGGWILMSPNGKQFHYQIKPTKSQDYVTGVYLNDQEVQKYVGDYLKKGLTDCRRIAYSPELRKHG